MRNTRELSACLSRVRTPSNKPPLIGISGAGAHYANPMIGELEMAMRKVNFRHMARCASARRHRTDFDPRRDTPRIVARNAMCIVKFRGLYELLMRIVTRHASDALIVDRGVIAPAGGQTVRLEPDVIHVMRTVGRHFLPGTVAAAAKVRLFLHA